MKLFFLLLIFIAGYTSLYSQQAPATQKNSDSIYIAVDSQPKFLNGDLISWLGKHIVYPQYAIEKHIEGKEFVSFVVEKDGAVSSIMLLRGVDTGLDREAKRVVSEMPPWKPATIKGQKVRAKLMLPISFKLMDYEEYVKANKVYCDTCVQKKPEFSKDLTGYIKNHLIWTKEALKNHAQGRVFVGFIIEKDGSLSHISVESYETQAYMLQDAAVNVVYEMPRFEKWTPGYIDGKPVRVKKVVEFDYIMRDFQRYKVSGFDPAQPLGN